MSRADEVARGRGAAIHFARQEFGKIIFIAGLVLAAIGALIWKTGGLGGLGKLPGDLFVQKSSSTFYFPIATCLLISAVLTLLAWLFRK